MKTKQRLKKTIINLTRKEDMNVIRRNWSCRKEKINIGEANKRKYKSNDIEKYNIYKRI